MLSALFYTDAVAGRLIWGEASFVGAELNKVTGLSQTHHVSSRKHNNMSLKRRKTCTLSGFELKNITSVCNRNWQRLPFSQ